jgi:hypothetical protein
MMKRSGIVVLATATLGLIASQALAALPFSTGFESPEGYTNGSQLVSNPNWTGDGQDTTGWQITNSTVGGSAASSGAQWVLASGASATTTKFQWTVTPVTDFTVQPAIMGSADVKLVSPAAGTIDRSTLAGVAMYDAAVNFIGGLTLIIDAQNLAGAGANAMLLELDFGDNTGVLYNLGVTNALNQYLNLGLKVDFTTNSVFGYLNGTQLPDVGSSGGATNFHDFDLLLGEVSTTAGGTLGRAGFDNYTVAQIPEPISMLLFVLGGCFALARRGRA